MSVATKAEQADEHDGKQENVRNKCDDHGDFGGFEVGRLAGANRIIPSIAELLRGSAGRSWIPKTASLPSKYLI
jgi:hypothetical protein